MKEIEIYIIIGVILWGGIISLIIESPIFFISLGIAGVIVLIIYLTFRRTHIKKEKEKLRLKEKEENIQSIIFAIKSKTIKKIGSIHKEQLIKEKGELLKKLNNTTNKYEIIFYSSALQLLDFKFPIIEILDKYLEAIKREEDISLYEKDLDNKVSNYLAFSVNVPEEHLSIEVSTQYKKMISFFKNWGKSCYITFVKENNQSSFHFGTGRKSNYNVDQQLFLNVKSNEEVLHFKLKTGNIYVYPYFIIFVKEKNDFLLFEWDKLHFTQKYSYVNVTGYFSKLNGANEVSRRYQHANLDGSPDMRFKHNNVYIKYGVSILNCLEIPEFNILIANTQKARRLLDELDAYKKLIASNTSNYFQPQSQQDFHFFKIFRKIIDDYGCSIVAEKRLVYLLADYNAYKEDYYAPKIIRDLSENSVLFKMSKKEISFTELITFSTLISNKIKRPFNEVLLFLTTLNQTILEKIDKTVNHNNI